MPGTVNTPMTISDGASYEMHTNELSIVDLEKLLRESVITKYEIRNGWASVVLSEPVRLYPEDHEFQVRRSNGCIRTV